MQMNVPMNVELPKVPSYAPPRTLCMFHDVEFHAPFSILTH